MYAIDGEDGAVLWQVGTGPAIEWVPDGLAVYGAAGSPAVGATIGVVAGLDGVICGFER